MSTRAQIEFYSPGSNFSLKSEPDARIYKHGDGYPSGQSGVLKQLRELKSLLSDRPMFNSIFGPRADDAEWAAAEFITKFRKPQGGQYYVSQKLHFDIRFLYRVITGEKWSVHVYTPHFNMTTDKLESLDFMFTTTF